MMVFGSSAKAPRVSDTTAQNSRSKFSRSDANDDGRRHFSSETSLSTKQLGARLTETFSVSNSEISTPNFLTLSENCRMTRTISGGRWMLIASARTTETTVSLPSKFSENEAERYVEANLTKIGYYEYVSAIFTIIFFLQEYHNSLIGYLDHPFYADHSSHVGQNHQEFFSGCYRALQNPKSNPAKPQPVTLDTVPREKIYQT